MLEPGAGGANKPIRACRGVNKTDHTGVFEKQFEKLTIPMMNFLVKRFTQAGLLCGNGAAKTAAAGFWPITRPNAHHLLHGQRATSLHQYRGPDQTNRETFNFKGLARFNHDGFVAQD